MLLRLHADQKCSACQLESLHGPDILAQLARKRQQKWITNALKLTATHAALPLYSLCCSALRPQASAQPLPAVIDAALSRCRATVCSHLFWPELPEHDLKLPQDLNTALEVS
jgi:hypothetical protein